MFPYKRVRVHPSGVSPCGAPYVFPMLLCFVYFIFVSGDYLSHGSLIFIEGFKIYKSLNFLKLGK